MLSAESVLTNRDVAWQHALTSRMNALYYRVMYATTAGSSQALLALEAEYRGHAHRFGRLYEFGGTEDELEAALVAFAATEVRETAIHPVPDAAKMETARKAVLRSISA